MSAYTPNSEPGEPTPAEQEPARRRAGRANSRGINFRLVNLLLLIPLVGTLPPMFYNSVAPRIGGMPFFYWYQLLWIPISVAVTYVVYHATRGDR